MMLHDSVELDELRYPIRIWAQEIAPDTEGAGRSRGAPGAYVEFGPLGCELHVIYASDGSLHPAAGARGGLPGAPSQQYRREVSGKLTDLDPCAHVVLASGETVVSICGGGGGYGPPVERDREQVRTDVREGIVSPERAARVYGLSDGSIAEPTASDGARDLDLKDARE
jgi:N-methylhydantoinase B